MNYTFTTPGIGQAACVTFLECKEYCVQQTSAFTLQQIAVWSSAGALAATATFLAWWWFAARG